MSADIGKPLPGLRAGRTVTLTAGDGHELDAWCVEPEGEARWGCVVLQEIFGVNAHMREVCAGYAALGATAVAPALFDRAKRGVDLNYDQAGVETGRKLREQVGWDGAVADVQAAVDFAARSGPVAVVGFCWGGTLAFLAAARFANVACTVSYYGGQTVPFAQEKIKAPVLMHFGSEDPRIPEADRKIILDANPDIEAYVYEADHGFNCDHRKEFHAMSAALAFERTFSFLTRHIGASRIHLPKTS